VPVHGIGADAKGRPFFAMRYVQGESLSSAIERLHSSQFTNCNVSERILELRKLLTRFVSVCQTIEYAHSRSVVHRDLKPANIMLGKFGETLIVDWGMAKRLNADQAQEDEGSSSATASESPDKTQDGAIFGTPAYMSPEQATGSCGKIGFASDIY